MTDLRFRTRSKPASFHPSRISLIQNYLNLKNMLVLDIGCGTGEYDYLLYKNKAIVIGCDIYIPALTIATKGNYHTHYVIADAMNLPLKNSSIEFTFINEVLEHLENDSKCIEESYRVLKEKGIIAIYAPNKFYPWETHLKIGKLPSFFLSWLPTNIRKKIFKIFKKDYASIYTRKKIHEKFNKDYHIIDCQEIFPRIRELQNKNYYYKIERTIEKLSKTPLRVFGVSIFIIAQKRTNIITNFNV